MSLYFSYKKDFDFKKTYYLSGPMTGYPDFNYPAFEQAYSDLTLPLMDNSGYRINVMSPHEEFKNDSEEKTASRTHDWYMKKSLRLMLECDGIILLPGWTKSKGARMELDIALDLDYPVLFYVDNTLVSMDRT